MTTLTTHVRTLTVVVVVVVIVVVCLKDIDGRIFSKLRIVIT